MNAVPSVNDLSKIPLMPNPHGEPPNFVDPPSLHPTSLSVGLTLMALSGIMLTVRLAVNLKLWKKLYMDDCMYALIIALTKPELGYFQWLCAHTKHWSHQCTITIFVLACSRLADLCIFAQLGGITYWILCHERKASLVRYMPRCTC